MSIGGGGGPFCVRARRSPTLPAPKKSSIAFAVEGRVTRTDIPGLCAALALVLEESGGEVVECEVGALVRADASVLLAKGALGGLFFSTDDCRTTYEQLKKLGVEFSQEPTEQPYGIDAGFRDPSGNQIRMAQLK